MNRSEFFDRLENICGSYKWDVDNNKVVAKIQRGWNRGLSLNPITALAHKSGFGFFSNTREGTEYAGRLLGIPRSLARNIYRATLGTYNHGDVQVVRGKIRSALEV